MPLRFFFIPLAILLFFVFPLLFLADRDADKAAAAYCKRQDWQAKLVIDSTYQLEKGYGLLRCNILSANKQAVITDRHKPFLFLIGVQQAVVVVGDLYNYEPGDTIEVDCRKQALRLHHGGKVTSRNLGRLPNSRFHTEIVAKLWEKGLIPVR